MGYNKYYNKIVKLSDLKYVTQENIDTAAINVTSADMYKEVHDLNMHFREMQRKRDSFLVEFWGTISLISATYAIIMIVFLLMTPESVSKCKVVPSPCLYFGQNLYLCLILATLFVAMIVFFIYIRKIIDWRLALILTVPLCGVHILFILDAIFLPVIIKMMRDIYDSIKDDVGYPSHFTQMNTSYIRDEESLEDGTMEEVKEKTFDDYRIKPEDDNGFL